MSQENQSQEWDIPDDQLDDLDPDEDGVDVEMKEERQNPKILGSEDLGRAFGMYAFFMLISPMIYFIFEIVPFLTQWQSIEEMFITGFVLMGMLFVYYKLVRLYRRFS